VAGVRGPEEGWVSKLLRRTGSDRSQDRKRELHPINRFRARLPKKMGKSEALGALQDPSLECGTLLKQDSGADSEAGL